MREVADGFVGEISNGRLNNSSTGTSYNALKDNVSGPTSAGSITYHGAAEPSTVMLARNGSFRGKPLNSETKEAIEYYFQEGASFVVGDMPGVDSQFIDYLDENKNTIEVTLFDNIVMDEGNEFKNEFTELLQEEKISIRRINPNKNDYKILAPLNAMCRFVRNQLIKKFIELDKQNQEGKKELKILITTAQINKHLKDLTKEHNFSRLVKPYNKTPAEITLDEIEQFNEIKRKHNGETDKKYKFEEGDIVKVQLKKEQLQKGRH